MTNTAWLDRELRRGTDAPLREDSFENPAYPWQWKDHRELEVMSQQLGLTPRDGERLADFLARMRRAVIGEI